MNNKGFTLIEVIVTIAIMGIITGIAYGSITSLQARNRNKRYQTYEKVLVTGAKLYVDQYGRDMWESSYDSACYYITYKTLVENKLIQEYNQTGETISTNSRVYVYYASDTSYSPYLLINSKSDNSKIVYKTDNYYSSSCTDVSLLGS